MTSSKHIAWDGGAVDAAIVATFGRGALDLIGRPKTQKTLCGVRVKASLIDNRVPSCTVCIGHRRREAAMHRELARLAEDVLR